MVKIRMQGSPEEMRIIYRILRRTKSIETRDLSAKVPVKNSERFYRQYVNLYIK